MKTKFIVLLLILQTAFAFAQRQKRGSVTEQIKENVSKKFNEWLEKTQFETNAEYETRIKNKSDEKLNEITNKVVQSLKQNAYPKRLSGNLGIYDAENETYLIELYSGESPSRFKFSNDTILVKIPRGIAPDFSEKLNAKGPGMCDYGITIIPNDWTLNNDRWTLTDATIIFYLDCYYDNRQCFRNVGEKGLIITQGNNDAVFIKCPYASSGKDGEFKIKDFKTVAKSNTLPSDNFFYYKWNISEQPNYNPSSSQPISFSLEDLNITLPTQTISANTVSTTKPQVPDLDMNSIKTKNSKPNAFAVVIGNKNYKSTKKVSYAINDATTIKNYLINVLGYKEGNIFYEPDATKSTFETYFGSKDNPQGILFNSIKPNISDVFIYYAGHGAPGLKDNKGYFVPIDCDPQYIEQGGYSLDLFYTNLSKLPAKSITVLTDACFSGADIFESISSIVITITDPIVAIDNCVILSSSAGSQVSSWYDEKQHGMFTYFFLKALQDKEKSDKNKDGKLTFEEIFDYISDKTEGVPYYARSIHGVEQTPTIRGTGIENVLIEYK